MHFYEGPYFYHFPIITFLTFVCIVIRIVWSYNGKTAKDTNNKYLIDVKVRTFDNTLILRYFGFATLQSDLKFFFQLLVNNVQLKTHYNMDVQHGGVNKTLMAQLR